MAIFKSINISKLDSVKRVLLPSASSMGTMGVFKERIDVPNTIALDDIAYLAVVPSNAIVHRLLFYNTNIDNAGALAIDIGIYNFSSRFKLGSTVYEPFKVISQNAYASGVGHLTAENFTGIDDTNRNRTPAQMGQRVWEDAGLASDPGVNLLIAATVVTGPTAAVAGTITIQYSFNREL